MAKKITPVEEGLFGDIAQTLSRATRGVVQKPSKARTNIAGRIANWLDPNKGLYGSSERERLAAKKFISNFSDRGVTTLTVAIQNKLANPNSNVYSLTTKAKVPKATAATLGLNANNTKPTSTNKVPTQPASQIIIPDTYRKKSTSESTYNKLNQIFENYISNLDKVEFIQEQQMTSLPSISQYFYDNFLKPYLTGIPFKPMEPKIHEILKNLPNLYKTGQLKRQLEELALIAYTLATRSIR